MQANTDVLEQLMGPTLRAITQPRSKQVGMAIEQARAAVQATAAAVHRHGRGLHQPSFDFGVTTTLVRLLDAITQDRWLSDLRALAHAVPHGSQILQEVAHLNALGSQPTQQELADRLRIDRGNFNRRIRKLTNLGLIGSSRRRQALLYTLTALGEEVARSRPIQEPTLSETLRASMSRYAEIAQSPHGPFAAPTLVSTADVSIGEAGGAFEWAARKAIPPRGPVVKFDTQLQETPA